jgi:hypothetical protein
MNEYWKNLRPLEKRLVVGVGSVLFVVLNWWFVVPHFSDLSKTDRRMKKAIATLALYNAELAKTNMYRTNIAILQGEGLSVPQEEQAFNFSSSVNIQAAQSGVGISSSGKIQSDTNQFFLELSQNVNVQSKEQSLVDFLYNLGSGNSLIRVRDLGLKPDPPRQQLMANIKLMASYQRKLPAKGVPAVNKAGAETTPAKPAAKKEPEPAKTKAAEPAKTTPKAPANSPEIPKPAPSTGSPPIKKFVPPNKKQS